MPVSNGRITKNETNAVNEYNITQWGYERRKAYGITKTKIKAGVDISKRKTFTKNIYQMNRSRIRIMDMGLKSSEGANNMSILNTYSPHMQYDKGEIEEYMGSVQ